MKRDLPEQLLSDAFLRDGSAAVPASADVAATTARMSPLQRAESRALLQRLAAQRAAELRSAAIGAMWQDLDRALAQAEDRTGRAARRFAASLARHWRGRAG